MFTKIDIHLSGPICNCEVRNLEWGAVPAQEENGAGLFIRCATCGTTLSVPKRKFVAGFVLQTPYPGKGGEPDGNESRLTVVDGGKVLRFAPENADPASTQSVFEPTNDDV